MDEDEEIKAYWASLEKASDLKDANGAPNGYDLPPLSKATLVEQLSHTAFWVTGMHETAGSIVEMFESPRNSATKVCQQGPEGEDGQPTRQTMADVQTYFQDMCVIASTGFR